MTDNIFEESNIVKGLWRKWEAVGDSVAGVYVKKETRPNTLKADGSNQTIYTLVLEDGRACKVAGPGGRALGQMDDVPFGAYVGIKYVEEIPAKRAGYKPTKVVTVFCKKGEDGKPVDMRMDVLNEFLGVETAEKLFKEENEIAPM